MSIDTAWIAPGVQVVTYQIGRTERFDNVARAQIVRVNKASFTLDNGDRYSLDSQERPGPSTWSGTYRCVPAESDEGRLVLANLKFQRSVARARVAVDEWRRDRTSKSRLAAIQALQAIDETHA